MDLKHIVEILQIGFAGFAFLMAGLSFKLLRQEQARDGTPRKSILDAIQRYLRYTLAMALLVASVSLIQPVVEASVEDGRREGLMLQNGAADCRDGLTRLTQASMRVAKDYDSLVRVVMADSAACRPVLVALENP